MFKVNKATYIALTGALALSIIGATVTSASAVESNGGSQAFYVKDTNNGKSFAPGAQLNFTTAAIAGPLQADSSGDASTLSERFIGPTDATSMFVFIAPVGSENTKTAWSAWSEPGMTPDSTDGYNPQAGLFQQNLGNVQGVKASGGTFSLGVAFTKNNGVTIIPGYTSFTKRRKRGRRPRFLQCMSPKLAHHCLA